MRIVLDCDPDGVGLEDRRSARRRVNLLHVQRIVRVFSHGAQTLKHTNTFNTSKLLQTGLRDSDVT